MVSEYLKAVGTLLSVYSSSAWENHSLYTFLRRTICQQLFELDIKITMWYPWHVWNLSSFTSLLTKTDSIRAKTVCKEFG